MVLRSLHLELLYLATEAYEHDMLVPGDGSCRLITDVRAGALNPLAQSGAAFLTVSPGFPMAHSWRAISLVKVSTKSWKVQ